MLKTPYIEKIIRKKSPEREKLDPKNRENHEEYAMNITILLLLKVAVEASLKKDFRSIEVKIQRKILKLESGQGLAQNLSFQNL